MVRTRSRVRLAAAAAVAVVALAGCEGAVELNLTNRVAPDSPTADDGLRALARAHSQAGCDAGTVTASPDPEATYGPGSIELTDRQRLDPALDAPEDDHKATNAIWQRFATDPRLDTARWDLMAAGQVRCGDGYLYMTLVLRSDGVVGWAPGVHRVTTADAAVRFGGISTDGTTVALQSGATDLVPGTTVPDVFLYDVPGDDLTATGVEPGQFDPGATPLLSGDGTTVFYEDEFSTDDGPYRGVRALDVATGTTTLRLGPDFAGYEAASASADGSVLAYLLFGAGGRELYVAAPGDRRDLGPGDGFTYDLSVSDDGRYVSINGSGTQVYDRTTSSSQVINPSCISDNPTTNGTALSADGRYLAYGCWDLDADQDGAVDVFVWDRTTGTSKAITSDHDGRRSLGGASISDDGRFVAFSYELPSAPSGAGTYLWDRTTGRSTLIAPVAADVAVSGDGSTVAFTAVAPDQTDPSITDLYVWDNPAA